jgi:hypothetical protein
MKTPPLTRWTKHILSISLEMRKTPAHTKKIFLVLIRFGVHIPQKRFPDSVYLTGLAQLQS